MVLAMTMLPTGTSMEMESGMTPSTIINAKYASCSDEDGYESKGEGSWNIFCSPTDDHCRSEHHGGEDDERSPRGAVKKEREDCADGKDLRDAS